MTNYQKDESIKVSVYCMAYNHAPYIKSALDGFVNQKTNFKYEVFVHDDASTDGTADIIIEYANKYPDIIKPILQSENQFSNGIKIVDDIIIPLIKGRYIAVCEGDDYWTDENKLQLEYDFLESHPDYVACTHNTIQYDCATGKEHLMYGSKNKEIFFDEVTKGGLSCYHISSLLYRKEYAIRPSCFYEKNVADFPQSLYLTLSGRVYYFGRVMSVYRYGTKESWSIRIGSNNSSFIKQMNYEIEMLKKVDEYMNYRKHETINKAILYCDYRVDRSCGRFKSIVKGTKYKIIMNDMSMKEKCSLYLNAYFPHIMKLYYRMKTGC